MIRGVGDRCSDSASWPDDTAGGHVQRNHHATGAPGGRGLAEEILRSVLEFQGGKARDDIAVVTISVPDVPA